MSCLRVGVWTSARAPRRPTSCFELLTASPEWRSSAGSQEGIFAMMTVSCRWCGRRARRGPMRVPIAGRRSVVLVCREPRDQVAATIDRVAETVEVGRDSFDRGRQGEGWDSYDGLLKGA